MKLAVLGDRTLTDYAVVEAAIKQSGFNPTELVLNGSKGICELAEKFAQEHKLKVTRFLPDWSDVKCQGAEISVNSWGKQFNKNAGRMSEEQVLMNSDCIIIIDEQNGKYLEKRAKDKNLKVYVHAFAKTERPDSDFDYKF